jgi:acyl-coenzyme A thioesterase PaaI-like protein
MAREWMGCGQRCQSNHLAFPPHQREIMKKSTRTVRTKQGIKAYTYLGCPLTRNRSPWCFRLCDPDENGAGECGRVAPHGFKSRIQMGIESHKQELHKAHYSKLENMYLSAPHNRYYDPAIKISGDVTEILVCIKDEFCFAGGSVADSVYFKAMNDAAFLAANSVIDDVLVLTVHFDTYLTRAIHASEIIARGRFVGVSGDNYLAESVLTDSEGTEIGRGHGVYAKSQLGLSANIGYE